MSSYKKKKKRVEVSKQPRAAEKKIKIVNKNIYWGTGMVGKSSE